jgi:hypothetical protein
LKPPAPPSLRGICGDARVAVSYRPPIPVHIVAGHRECGVVFANDLTKVLQSPNSHVWTRTQRDVKSAFRAGRCHASMRIAQSANADARHLCQGVTVRPCASVPSIGMLSSRHCSNAPSTSAAAGKRGTASKARWDGWRARRRCKGGLAFDRRTQTTQRRKRELVLAPRASERR